MSPHERSDLPADFRRLLVIWRGLIELGCSPAEIRRGLSCPDSDFERWVAASRAGRAA